MLSVEAARARILDGLGTVGAELVGLGEADRRILAAPVAARRDQPACDLSAMDGWALAGPVAAGARLRVVGRAPAGRPWEGTVGPGETVRVFTGSVLPAGADRVLLQEDAEAAADPAGGTGEAIAAGIAVEAGRHVRPRGGDFRAGDVLLEPGHRLHARAIGLAAACDHAWLSVRRRPRIALLATGDEIVPPGSPIPPGGIPSSNPFALAAMVRAAGGEALVLPSAPDREAAIADAAARAFGCDLLVTIGGASVGDHDLVRPALARHGFEPAVLRIAMRPGKPLMFGRLREGTGSDATAGRLPVLGLPGNPVSALVCAALFLRPAIDALLGLPAAAPPRLSAVLGAAMAANDHRADHVRARLRPMPDGSLPVATPTGKQDSARLADLARADALILRAPHAPAAAAGDPVEVLSLPALGL